MTNEVAVTNSTLAKANNMYLAQIQAQLQEHDLEFSNSQRASVISAISEINKLLVHEGMDFKTVDQSNITDILLNVAALDLNAASQPSPVYFSTRNVYTKDRKSSTKMIEMGIQGDGNDQLLKKYGSGVKTVHPFWAVREKDEFKYARHVGLKTQPPEWVEHGEGKYIRVVYPITFEDGQVSYFIAERDDVKRNLLAHVSQNLMWDKGNAKSDFMKKAADMTLDQILDDPEMVKLGKISPAWASPQSREAMILRKMRNNVVKKVPKDFTNAFASLQYDHIQNGEYERTRKEVEEKGNSVDFDEQEAPELPASKKVEAPKPAKKVTPHDAETGEIIEPKSDPAPALKDEGTSYDEGDEPF